MPWFVIPIYLSLCALCGIIGRSTTIGFMGHFLLSIVLTPFLDFLIQAVGRPNARMRAHLRNTKQQ